MGGNPRNRNGSRRRLLRARVLAAYDTCAICGLNHGSESRSGLRFIYDGWLAEQPNAPAR